MNIVELQKILAQGESEILEFKLGNTSPENLASVICAFLNGRGGRVLLGVSDIGKVIGVDNVGKVLNEIQNKLSELITPRSVWTFESIQIQEKEIVVIDIPEGRDKPYVVGGSIFFRRGGSVVKATRDDISDLIQKRSLTSHRWERQLAVGAELEDLDLNLIVETGRRAIDAQRWQGTADNVVEFLDSFGLITSGSITNAALILFGKQPTKFFPQARVRLLVLPSGKTGDQYSVDRIFESAVLQIVDSIVPALVTYVGGAASNFSKVNWQREDRPIFPMSALREGVMNAIVHRDYSLNSEIVISVLSHSLQIISPGGLPIELTPAALKRDHQSMPRNPDIAHLCFLYGLIEKVGRGTQLIVEDCKGSKLREPRWSSSVLETKLTFFGPSIASKEMLSADLNERQNKILLLVRERDSLSSSGLAKIFGGIVTGRTVRQDLQMLVDGGWLVRRGRGRGTSYAMGSREYSR